MTSTMTNPATEELARQARAPIQALQSGPISQSAPQPAAPSVDLGITPAQASSTTQTGAGSSGVNSALASQIAKAISVGLAPQPTTAAQWAKLADFYSTPAGENQLTTAATAGAFAQPVQGAVAVQAAPTPGQGALGTNAFLSAIRQHESGGNYSAHNAAGGAYGAYQFIDSTWASQANAAGFSQYAHGHASDAPPSVQDAVASHMANAYFTQYGSWQNAAEAWYSPADVGKNVVPVPGAGNTESVTAYGAQIVKMMGQQPQLDPQHPAAGATSNVVKIASTQLGLPYQWGGENPGKSFDCSGLVQWTYGQAGVKLPRVAQDQYNATAKIAKNAPLQPGDLLFFGAGPGSIEHVGIYIGNNQMIDAPHTGADVRIDANPTGWGNYVGATRPGDPGGSTTAAPQTPADTTQQQSNQNFGAILQTVTQQLAALHQTYPGAGQGAAQPTRAA